MTSAKRLVIALGGNALEGADGDVCDQAIAARRAMESLAPAILECPHVLLTHGNGPQVGNLMLRSEMAVTAGLLPPLPIDTCVADTVGGLGYLLTRELRTVLDHRGAARETVAMITSTVVDPLGVEPTKPIGKLYPMEMAAELASRGWSTVVTPRGGIRRVLPSPMPERVLETGTVRLLFESGVIVVAGGGGGVPVQKEAASGDWCGVDAVVDKDLVSALLGIELGADVLLILTDIDEARVNFGEVGEAPLRAVTVGEVRKHLEAGAFGDGSMGPKIEAACRFVEGGGLRAVICHLENAVEGLSGNSGTQITDNPI